MGNRYLVRIEAWPHNTGRGSRIDQIQVGQRCHTFEVHAGDMQGALMSAALIAKGMQTGPLVWMTPITELRQLRDDERVPSSYDAHCNDLCEAAKLQMPINAGVKP